MSDTREIIYAGADQEQGDNFLYWTDHSQDFIALFNGDGSYSTLTVYNAFVREDDDDASTTLADLNYDGIPKSVFQ